MRKGGSSLYWVSEGRNRLVVPGTGYARHREVVAEEARGWSFIIFVSAGGKGKKVVVVVVGGEGFAFI